MEVSTRKARLFAPLGGVLTVWFVALAALLLYPDASARKLTGMERRVHTRMLETMPPGVCLTDDTGFIIYTNPAAHAMLGYKPGELIARRTNAVHSFPEEGTLPSATSSKCVGEAIWAGELPSRRKDGTTIASQVWGARVDVPGKLYWIFVQDGVSAKK